MQNYISIAFCCALFISSAVNCNDYDGRDFGKDDNCFSISSFATFNLVLLTTVINVATNFNSDNNDNNDNNNNNLNNNQNGEEGNARKRWRRRAAKASPENPFFIAALKTFAWMQCKVSKCITLSDIHCYFYLLLAHITHMRVCTCSSSSTVSNNTIFIFSALNNFHITFIYTENLNSPTLPITSPNFSDTVVQQQQQSIVIATCGMTNSCAKYARLYMPVAPLPVSNCDFLYNSCRSNAKHSYSIVWRLLTHYSGNLGKEFGISSE
jgi:hypothetical protein